MRIKVELASNQETILPIHYGHIVQGLLYKNLSDRQYSDFLHKTGYWQGNKQFKLFTYSRLLAPFTLDKRGTITFKPPIHLIISSAVEQFITDVAETLIKSDFQVLGNNRLEIGSITVEREPRFGESAKIKMLSPMVAYSTSHPDEKTKRTDYYSPWQNRFEEIVRANLIVKYQLLYGGKPSDDTLQVIPNGNGSQEQRFKAVVNYKGTYIVGYNGIYWLKGNPDLIKVAYDTGLGSKNSQGFGCWEVVGREF